MNSYNNNNRAHGFWSACDDSDRVIYKCTFVNGKMVGYEEFRGDKIFHLK